MKIPLSDYWRKSSLFNLCLLIFIVFGTIAFCIWSRDKEVYIIVICALPFIIILIAMLLCSRRFLTYVIVEAHQTQAYSFFNKELCSINFDTQVYYSIFKSTEGGIYTKQFIAVSNVPFKYQPVYGASKIKFIQHYDLKKQIVMPYNEKIIPFLKLDDWIKVN